MQFDTDFEDTMKEVTDSASEFYSKIEYILSKPNVGKHDRELILKQIDGLKMQIESNVPFMKKQWSEQLDKTVIEAKNEISAFLEDKIITFGLEGYKKEIQKSLGYVTGEEK